MARKEPALCTDTTETAGVGTYTLLAPGAGGYQTLARAVTSGLVANGDTIVYRVSDPSDPVAYEIGIGTVGSAGSTVSRDTILERDDGTTSPKSWPSGGTRNFVVTWWPGEFAKIVNQGSDYTAATFATNLGLPRLAVANVFTEQQTIYKMGGTATNLLLQSDAVSGRPSNVYLRGANSAAAQVNYALLRSRAVLSTAGAEDGALEIFVVSGGVDTEVAQVNKDGSIDNVVAGTSYFAPPSGFAMLAESVPTGWTRSNETVRRAVRLSMAADTLGAVGGSDDMWDGAWTTNAKILTTAELPSHTHTIPGVSGTGGAGAGLYYVTDATDTVDPAGTSNAAGSGTGHSHTMNTPYYRIMGRIVKT